MKTAIKIFGIEIIALAIAGCGLFDLFGGKDKDKGVTYSFYKADHSISSDVFQLFFDVLPPTDPGTYKILDGSPSDLQSQCDEANKWIGQTYRLKKTTGKEADYEALIDEIDKILAGAGTALGKRVDSMSRGGVVGIRDAEHYIYAFGIFREN
jgi:hypothetical protein